MIQKILPLLLIFFVSIEVVFAVDDPVQKFLADRPPLAGSQRELLGKQALKHILGLPWDGMRCAANLLTGHTYQALLEHPETLDLLKVHSARRIPDARNTFEIVNNAASFAEVCPNKTGFCMGISEGMRKLNMLSFFDPESNLMHAPPRANIAKFFNYYKSALDEIFNNHPAILPGFSDLQEMSRDPLVGRYLKEQVAKTWAEKNATLGGLKMLMSVKKTFTAENGEELFKNLSERTERNYNPLIYLSVPNESITSPDLFIHIVQVYKVSAKNAKGDYDIYLWNINNPAPNDAQMIQVFGDGRAYFGSRKLSAVDIVPWDDADVSEAVFNTANFCKKYRALCLKQAH